MKKLTLGQIEGYRTLCVADIGILCDMAVTSLRLIETMRAIAKPAIGGKAQQYMAQDILRDLGEKS